MLASPEQAFAPPSKRGPSHSGGRAPRAAAGDDLPREGLAIAVREAEALLDPVHVGGVLEADPEEAEPPVDLAEVLEDAGVPEAVLVADLEQGSLPLRRERAEDGARED